MAKYKKRKDGRYCALVTIGKDSNGKLIRKAVYGSTIKELEENKAKILVDMEHRTYVKDKTVKWKDISQKWFEGKKIELETNSWMMYERMLNKYLSVLDEKNMIDVTYDDFQNIINENLDKPTTCYKLRLTINQICEFALARSVIFRNPAIGLSIPKYKSPEKRALTTEEKKIFKETPLTPREELYIRLIRHYGVRKQEALALIVDDFDFEKEKIFITKAVEYPHNQMVVKATKSGHTRNFYMFREDIPFFKAYISDLNCSKCRYVFRVADGSRWITNISFRHMFDSIKAKCGINDETDISSHTFRHTFVTDCYYAGVKLKDAQYLAGHSSLAVTLGIYTHLDEQKSDNRKLLEKFAG